MLNEMETSKSILEKEPRREEAAREALRKIVLSEQLKRSLFLRHTDDLFVVYCGLVESVNREPDNKIPVLVSKTIELVKAASQKAGRILEPGTAVEGAILLGDLLRVDGVQILEAAEDAEGANCEILCATKGCDSVETVRLSKQSLDDIRATRAIYRCPLHLS